MGASSTSALLTHYRRALQRALDLFGRLSDEDWNASGRRGQWNAKEYLAHLTASQEREGNVVTRQSLAGERPALEGLERPQQINEFNARIIEEVRHLPPQDLLARFRAAFEENLAQLAGTTDDDLARTVEHPGWFRPGTLAQVFHTGYLHIPLHYQNIRRCARRRTRLPHWMEVSTADEVHDLLARTFDYLPLTYWAERGEHLNATVVFDLTGPGGGTWTVEITGADCRSYEGRPERRDLELRATPAHWVDTTTGDLNPLWGFLSRRIGIKGNILLSLKLERLFEPT